MSTLTINITLLTTILILAGSFLWLWHRYNKQQKILDRYNLLTETMYDIFWILDPETHTFTYVSPSVKRMRGYTVDEIMAEPVDAALTEEARLIVRKTISQEMQKFISGEITDKKYFFHQLPQPCKDGSLVWTEVITHYFHDPVTQKVMIHGVTRDITERHKLDEQLHQMAKHDALTHLMNRHAFYEKGNLWFWSAYENKSGLSMVQFDLNHFKQINDTLGHNIGDKVLQIFAGHLERVFPKNEKTMIARLGGDEFTILMLDTMPNIVESLCTQLTESLAKPVLIEDKNVLIRTAYGIASLNNHSSLEELAICADKELYKHKEKTKRDK